MRNTTVLLSTSIFTSDYYRMVLEQLKPIIEYVDQNRRFGRFDFFLFIVIYRRAFNKIIIKKYDMTRDLF